MLIIKFCLLCRTNTKTCNRCLASPGDTTNVMLTQILWTLVTGWSLYADMAASMHTYLWSQIVEPSDHLFASTDTPQHKTNMSVRCGGAPDSGQCLLMTPPINLTTQSLMAGSREDGARSARMVHSPNPENPPSFTNLQLSSDIRPHFDAPNAAHMGERQAPQCCAGMSADG